MAIFRHHIGIGLLFTSLIGKLPNFGYNLLIDLVDYKFGLGQVREGTYILFGLVYTGPLERGELWKLFLSRIYVIGVIARANVY